MKYIWELADIIPGRTIRSKSNAPNNQYLIGYIRIEKVKKFCLISLTDGKVHSVEDVENFIRRLNTYEYRPMTVEKPRD